MTRILGIAIPQLVKYYFSCQSIRALELLCHVQTPKILLDQICDHLNKNPQGAIILIARIFQKSPTLFTNFPSNEIFSKIMDFIKAGKNMEIINSVLLLIASVLPFCPGNEALVRDLFRCFLDACKLYHQKRKSSLEKLRSVIEQEGNQFERPFVMANVICLMQTDALQVSLQIFFNAVYGIYPNNVLVLLQ